MATQCIRVCTLPASGRLGAGTHLICFDFDLDLSSLLPTRIPQLIVYPANIDSSKPLFSCWLLSVAQVQHHSSLARALPFSALLTSSLLVDLTSTVGHTSRIR